MIELDYEKGRLAVFLRHAEREKSDTMIVGEEIMLTPEGIATAHKLGQNLKSFPVRAIYSSPFLRCVQTANAINEELSNYAIDTVLTNKLGLPGLSIADTDMSGLLYANHTAREIYDQYTKGKEMKTLTPATSLAKNTMEFLHSVCKEDGVFLFISHDATIAHIRYALTGYIYRDNEWVDFLDGFVISL